MSNKFNRVALLILDSVGIGEMPDAAAWGDDGADTLGHILAARPVALPHLRELGLGNVRALPYVAPVERPQGCYGRCALKSNGKDTTTGHWEIAGIILERAFPTYPQGFPPEVIDRFVNETGVPGVLGNVAASGTEILKELGAEHLRTGRPIVYTSADSVFQIAAHEQIIPVPKLYEMCATARRLLSGEHQVGRVIARPFEGEPGDFRRTANRHDYAVPPPPENLLAELFNRNLDVVCIGKIASIYDNMGVTAERPTKNNEQGIDQVVAALEEDSRGLIFANLVDFDMLYGHRRDVEGYARALEYFDARLPEIRRAMKPDDLLIIAADHGNDPAFRGTDHTREYVPLLVCGAGVPQGVALGTRESLADIGQTIAENFGARLPAGTSFLSEVGGGRSEQ